MLKLDQRFLHSDAVVAQRAAETTVLFHLERGSYYSLDEVGGRVWELCDGSHSAEQVIGMIAEEYDAPEETIRADVLDLFEDLVDEELLARDASAA